MPDDDYVFGEDDIGCWADGAGGQKHVREVLAGLVAGLGDLDLARELQDVPSDDFSEEDGAIELLNESTAEGFLWGMKEGDLMLSPVEWWEEAP